MEEGDLIKGVWFVTARRHVLESQGASALHAIAGGMRPENRHAMLEPLSSEWYAEEVFQDSLHAVHDVHAKLDTRVFDKFLEDCTVLGINAFFRVLLRASSPAYLLRQMPAVGRQYRRNAWVCEVDAGEERGTIAWRNVPYLADRVYRHCAIVTTVQCLQVCTGVRPRAEIVDQGADFMTVGLSYGR